MHRIFTRRRTGIASLGAAGLVTAALAGVLGAGAAQADPASGGNVAGDGSSRAAAPAAIAAPFDDPRFAVVSPNGTLVRGRNAVSAFRLAAGNYEVIFDRDIRNCAFVGTAGSTGGGNPQGGQIAVAQRSGNVNGVYVDTRDSQGFTIDRGFHLVVVC
ncbi:hypothetical protein GCM10009557_75940 [Virgisporangium ochraceum]|uniref:Uncharacterized protein n=1 Tax=Virgisporangium ochraceum TaxID=65505 RepID=A0A8J4A0G8_9ACTN|nr:hypothetical protein [Virgisporangium ochraceum]GIJ72292.1 hypothetical protein Voc01_072090 [Virgisporangium ochraceum]